MLCYGYLDIEVCDTIFKGLVELHVGLIQLFNLLPEIDGAWHSSSLEKQSRGSCAKTVISCQKPIAVCCNDIYTGEKVLHCYYLEGRDVKHATCGPKLASQKVQSGLKYKNYTEHINSQSFGHILPNIISSG